MTTYLDWYPSGYPSNYGVPIGAVFPAYVLTIKVELLLNGTWTDITSYCYQRDSSVNVHVTNGRPDESSKLVTAQMTVELNNRGGTFSAKNPAGPFYGMLTRNTQIRMSAQAYPDDLSTTPALTYWFWGEVSEWPPQWDPTGADVWMDITANGITRRLTQQASIGSALARWYLKKAANDPTAPVAYWTCEDGSSSTQFAEATGNGTAAILIGTPLPTLASDSSWVGSDPLPVINGSTWNASTGSYSPAGDIVLLGPASTTWTAPAGVTSVDVICVGAGGGGGGSDVSGQPAGGGGGGEYAEEPAYTVVPGNTYNIVIGAGGAGGQAASDNNGGDGGNTSFDGTGVVAHGGGYGSHAHAGVAGSGSTNTVHHNGGAGYYNSSVNGGGGGSSGGSAHTGTSATSGTGAAPPDSYAGVGGDGGGAGSGGGGGGSKNYVGTYVAQHSYAYAGSDGTDPNSLLWTDTTMEQGGDSADTFNGHAKTWILFNHSQIASDLSGATITKVTLTLYSWHWWYNAGGTISVGWDTTTSFPSTKGDPSGHTSLYETSMTVGEIGTLSIGTQFGTAFKSSGATSIVLYKASNDLHYYAKLNGAKQSNAPTLRIYYSK